MSRESSKNRKIEIWKAIIGASAIIIAAFIGIKYSKSEKLKSNSNQNIEIQDNNGTINNTNIEGNNGNIYTGNNTIVNEVKNDVKAGYSIKGSNELLNLLKSEKTLQINQSSSNILKLTHSNSLRQFSKDSNIYQYQGGHLILLFNSDLCFEFKEFKINSIPANTKEQIESYINEQINNFVKLNPHKFKNAIQSCI